MSDIGFPMTGGSQCHIKIEAATTPFTVRAAWSWRNTATGKMDQGGAGAVGTVGATLTISTGTTIDHGLENLNIYNEGPNTATVGVYIWGQLVARKALQSFSRWRWQAGLADALT